MYSILNMLCIGLFSSLSLFNLVNEMPLRTILLTYFIVDSYNNKWDVVLHHMCYSIFTIVCPFEYVQKTLLFEWSTLFLLLYKQSLPTKELFVVSWVLTRLVYCPYLWFTFTHEHYFINHLSILIHGLHFHWTCKIVNPKINTMSGYSSMLLMLIPLHRLNYEVSLQTYLILYLQSQLSFYYHVFQTDLLLSLDTCMIMYICLDYLDIYPYISLFYVIYKRVGSICFHRYVFVIAVSKLCYVYNEVIPYVVIGIYTSIYSYRAYWHICAGVILSYCFYEQVPNSNLLNT